MRELQSVNTLNGYSKIKKMSVINSRYYWAISLNCDKTFQMIVRLLKAVKRFALVALICFPNLKSNQKQRDTIRNPKCHKDTKSTNRIPLETRTWRTDWDWDTWENRKRERKVRGTSHFSYLSFGPEVVSVRHLAERQGARTRERCLHASLFNPLSYWLDAAVDQTDLIRNRQKITSNHRITLAKDTSVVVLSKFYINKNVFIIINPSKQLFFFLQAKIRSGFKSFSEDTHWNGTMSGLRSSNLQ